MKKIKTLIILVFAFVISFAWAQPPIPDASGRWIIDDAHVISESTEQTISNLCQKEFDSTSNQVVVYIFSSLQGSTIEKYANEVFNEWKIGSKKDNNGILLIVAVDDHQLRIEVGYGLEAYLTDLEASDIIENEIKPNFKKGDFDQGILSGVQNIIYGIKNSYVASNTSSYLISTKSHHPHVNAFYFILFAIWLGISVFSSRMKIGEGIFNIIFFAMFLMPFAFMMYGGLLGAILCIVGLITMFILHFAWKPKKPIKFWSASGNGGSWSSSSSSSSWSSSSYDSGSSWSSGGGGFSGGGGSSGGGGASGSW